MTSDDLHFFISFLFPKYTTYIYIYKTSKYHPAELVGGIFIGVDNHSQVPFGSRGRASVRLESIQRYNDGLFIISLEHAPTGAIALDKVVIPMHRSQRYSSIFHD